MFVNTVLLLAVSVLIGLLRGGSVSRLSQVKVSHAWLVVVSFLVQFGAIFLDQRYVYIIDILTYVAILAFAILNRKRIAILVILIGVIMNFSAMLTNGGRMPVYIPDAKLIAPNAIPSLVAGTYGKQIAMSAHTHLNFLGDLFYLGSPYPNPTLLSAGDLVIFVGIFLFIQQAMVKPSGIFQGESNGEAESP